MNLFADDVEAGRPSRLAASLVLVPRGIASGIASTLTKTGLDYLTKKLMYIYTGREDLRRTMGQPLLKLDYGVYAHRIALGKACLAQARAEKEGFSILCFTQSERGSFEDFGTGKHIAVHRHLR